MSAYGDQYGDQYGAQGGENPLYAAQGAPPPSPVGRVASRQVSFERPSGVVPGGDMQKPAAGPAPAAGSKAETLELALHRLAAAAGDGLGPDNADKVRCQKYALPRSGCMSDHALSQRASPVVTRCSLFGRWPRPSTKRWTR